MDENSVIVVYTTPDGLTLNKANQRFSAWDGMFRKRGDVAIRISDKYLVSKFKGLYDVLEEAEFEIIGGM